MNQIMKTNLDHLLVEPIFFAEGSAEESNTFLTQLTALTEYVV